MFAVFWGEKYASRLPKDVAFFIPENPLRSAVPSRDMVLAVVADKSVLFYAVNKQVKSTFGVTSCSTILLTVGKLLLQPGDLIHRTSLRQAISFLGLIHLSFSFRQTYRRGYWNQRTITSKAGCRWNERPMSAAVPNHLSVQRSCLSRGYA